MALELFRLVVVEVPIGSSFRQIAKGPLKHSFEIMLQTYNHELKMYGSNNSLDIRTRVRQSQ